MEKLIITLFITPLAYIILGLVLILYPPRNINDFSGYRTKRSKKSQYMWDYAQKVSGGYSLIFGIILSLLTGGFVWISLVVSLYWVYYLIPLAIQLIPFLFIYFLTEHKLKHHQKPSFKEHIKEEDIIH